MITGLPPNEAAAERQSGDRMRVLNEVHRAVATSISLDDLLELVLDRAFVHLRPEETVFIDDMKSFIEGARKTGMHAVRFTTRVQLMRDLCKLGIRF